MSGLRARSGLVSGRSSHACRVRFEDDMFLRKICNMHRLCRRCSSNSSQLVLYGDDASPPVRFVRMTAAALRLPLVYRRLDLFRGEHATDEYRQINPLQKVPALATGSEVIADSHAIALFLCARAGGRARSLLPAAPLRRARVLELLFYNASTLFPIDSSLLSSFFADRWPVAEQLAAWQRALDHLEWRLRDHAWLAGDEMSLCDLCVIATVTSVETLVPLSRRHARLQQWARQFSDVPVYHINRLGIQRLRSFIDVLRMQRLLFEPTNLRNYWTDLKYYFTNVGTWYS